MTQTQKVEAAPTTTEAEALRAKIVRMDNEPLLKLHTLVHELSRNLDRGSWYDATKALKDERDGLLKEIKIFSDALDQEYKKRLLRGYRLELQKLLAMLQPKVPSEVQGRRIIPLNAAAAERDGESSQEGTPEALVLLEQLRDLLLGVVTTPGADIAKEDNATKS